MSEAIDLERARRQRTIEPAESGRLLSWLAGLGTALVKAADPSGENQEDVLPVLRALTVARTAADAAEHVERLARFAEMRREVQAREAALGHEIRRRNTALVQLASVCVDFLGRAFADTPDVEDSCAEIRGELPRSDAGRLHAFRVRLVEKLTRYDESLLPVQRHKSVIKGVLRDLAEQLSSATAGSSSFVEAAARIRERVEAAEDLDDLRTLQQLLIRETVQASSEAASLNDRLCDLKAQVARSQAQIGELEQALSASREAMNLDALTQVPNRRGLDAWVARELYDEAGMPKRPYTLLVLDLDHFKDINDTYGHLAGDRVLALAAQRLQHGIREVDFLARYGGEEFVLVLPDCGLRIGKAVADRMRALLSRRPIVHERHQIRVTMSVGVASVRSGEPFRAVFDRADQCVYRAKAGGRDRVVTEECSSS